MIIVAIQLLKPDKFGFFGGFKDNFLYKLNEMWFGLKNSKLIHFKLEIYETRIIFFPKNGTYLFVQYLDLMP